MLIELKYGNTNTYFIRGTLGNLLVDTDYAGTLPAFYKAIKSNGIQIRDINYVLATHYHPDHIGLVSELMKQGVKLLLIDTQCPYVHFADEIFARDKRLNYELIEEGKAEIVSCEASRSILKRIGIDGEIISVTSHSEDGVCLILDSGECIVGDLEPIDCLDAYEHNEKLQADWNRVLSYAPVIIYYGHANPRPL